MGMGDEKVGNLLAADVGFLQLVEDAIATARIDEHHVTGLGFHNEAGIVAFGYHSIAGTQYDDFVIHDGILFLQS